MEDVMKYGARNQIVGKVESIKKGTVMSEVKLKVLTCNFMESVMTMNSLKELGIKKGDKVRIVVKAVNVLLVKE
jgi:molybdopterin-binding protein